MPTNVKDENRGLKGIDPGGAAHSAVGNIGEDHQTNQQAANPRRNSAISAARERNEAGDLAGALDAYTALINEQAELPTIIEDLTQTAAANPRPDVVRLLGDAFMRDGQLQNALDTYRRALDLM